MENQHPKPHLHVLKEHVTGLYMLSILVETTHYQTQGEPDVVINPQNEDVVVTISMTPLIGGGEASFEQISADLGPLTTHETILVELIDTSVSGPPMENKLGKAKVHFEDAEEEEDTGGGA